jgi:peptidoglycan/LPS O-acetylase OafA/YrhL
MQPQSGRRVGLDLMRVAASLTIITYHGVLPASRVVWIPGLGWLAERIQTHGYLAVDIFFVLSGWLLTSQALAAARLQAGSRLEFAWRFWTRRWFRILPTYWFILGVLLLTGRWTLGEFARHSVFLQTVLPPNLLPITWSLVAEECFYIALPLVVLLARHVTSPWIWLGSAGLGLVVPTVVRAVYVADRPWVDTVVQPEARFEGLVIGATLAAIATARPTWYGKVDRVRRPLALGGLITASVIVGLAGRDDWWFQVPGLVVFSIAISAIVPYLAASRPAAWVPAPVIVGLTWLSDLTYPLYLVHPFVLRTPPATSTSGVLHDVLGPVVLLVVAAALHLAIERPFLSLRERVVVRKNPAIPRI